MSKVLVTGGAGFIGSNIVDLLIEKGYRIVVVDNLITGKKTNINERAKFYKVDICDLRLSNIFKKEKPDYVIHEAAQINVRSSIRNPLFDANVNIIGSINLLENCKKFSVKKIVYASSGGAVYGEPKSLPCDEKHSINPISPYGVSKHVVEHYLFQYWKNYSLNHSILRYSNVYGPRQDPEGEAGVISIFIDNLLNNKAPTINGDGNQTRDFVCVEDVAKANLLALEKKTKKKIFNIGFGKEISINKLYEGINSILKTDIKHLHGPDIPGEVRKIYLDINLAKKELNFEPEIDLSNGLRKTIDWFKSKDL